MAEYRSNYVVVMGKYQSPPKLYTFTYDELRDFLLDHLCEVEDEQTSTQFMIRRAIKIGESRIYTNNPLDDEYGVLAVIMGKKSNN
jgi:hypothetical protein